MSSGGRRLNTNTVILLLSLTTLGSPHEVSIQKVGELLLEEPQLVTAAPRYELSEGLALLVWLQAGELTHHALQPGGEGLAEIYHDHSVYCLQRTLLIIIV